MCKRVTNMVMRLRRSCVGHKGVLLWAGMDAVRMDLWEISCSLLDWDRNTDTPFVVSLALALAVGRNWSDGFILQASWYIKHSSNDTGITQCVHVGINEIEAVCTVMHYGRLRQEFSCWGWWTAKVVCLYAYKDG